MLDEVCVAGVAALGSDASAVLGAELAERRALDVAQVGDGDDHLVVGIEVLLSHVGECCNRLRAYSVREL